MKKTAFPFLVTLSVLSTILFIGGCGKTPPSSNTTSVNTTPINTPAVQHQPPILSPESTPAEAAASDTKPATQTPEQSATANTTTTLYKCKTDSGVTFSDSPCGGQQETVVLKEPMVVDNSGLRAKAAQWKEQDAEDDANRSKNNKPKAILIGDSSGNRDTDAENGSDQTDMDDDLGYPGDGYPGYGYPGFPLPNLPVGVTPPIIENPTLTPGSSVTNEAKRGMSRTTGQKRQ